MKFYADIFFQNKEQFATGTSALSPCMDASRASCSKKTKSKQAVEIISPFEKLDQRWLFNHQPTKTTHVMTLKRICPLTCCRFRSVKFFHRSNFSWSKNFIIEQNRGDSSLRSLKNDMTQSYLTISRNENEMAGKRNRKFTFYSLTSVETVSGLIALQSSSLLSRIRNADYSLRFLVRRHQKFFFWSRGSKNNRIIVKESVSSLLPFWWRREYSFFLLWNYNLYQRS